MFFRIFVALIAVVLAGPLWALESANVLPQGVRSFGVRTGMYKGLADYYNADGDLMSVGDQYSVAFDSQTLIKFKPEARQLVEALNAIGPYNLGDALHLGTLKIDANPELKYTALVGAYGITKRWTLGVGLPIIQYTNDVRVTQTESNVNTIRAQVQGISAELSQGLDQVDSNLVQAMHDEMQTKGYKPIGSVNEYFVGDLQVANIFLFHNLRRFRGVLRTVLTLPTGPENNADDLTDLDNFHRFSLGLEWREDFKINSEWVVGLNGGYVWAIADQIDKRVPNTSQDVFIDASRKERVTRDLGDSVYAQINTRYSFANYFEAGTGYEKGFKQKDQYSGARDYNYGLLENNTNQNWDIFSLGFEFTTVKAFMRKMADVPLSIAYTYKDIFSGLNIQRQAIHEISVTMYF